MIIYEGRPGFSVLVSRLLYRPSTGVVTLFTDRPDPIFSAIAVAAE
ncbi:MAG: hypothetical protein JEZ11_00490 [Desulfobacterales bacterium]|nr:hypothetical protein [Desulfobacterales bacterium]